MIDQVPLQMKSVPAPDTDTHITHQTILLDKKTVEAEKGKQKRLYVDRVVDRTLRCFFEIDALGKSCKQIDQSDRYKFTQHRSAVQTTRCGLAAGSSLCVSVCVRARACVCDSDK